MWGCRSINPLNVFAKGIDGMVFLNLQGQLGNLWFARASYRRGCKPTKESVFIFIAIVLLHVVLIFIALNAKFKQREASVAPAFKMIYLSQEKPPDLLELHIPVVERASVKTTLVLPEIILEEQPALALPLDYPQSNYQLPNPNDAKYRDAFDPKMRQKLIDAQVINRPRAKEKSSSWTESDGRVFIDVGNGNCLVSMPKTDWRERGTNWGSTRCGKMDSEKMMDSVMADFESRKNPLKTK